MTAALLLLAALANASDGSTAGAAPTQTELAQCWASRYFSTPGPAPAASPLFPAVQDRVRSCVALEPSSRTEDSKRLPPHSIIVVPREQPRWRHMPPREFQTTPEPRVIELAQND